MATRPAYVYNGSGWDDIGDKRIGAEAGDIPQASVEDLTSDLAAKLDATSQTIIQVVSAAYSSATSTTSSSFQDTGLSATITPTSASNKVLVIATGGTVERAAGSTNNNGVMMQLVRGATQIADGNGPLYWTGTNFRLRGAGHSFAVLDTPSTTSATTYKTQFRSNSSESVTVQKAGSTATIVLMEVSA